MRRNIRLITALLGAALTACAAPAAATNPVASGSTRPAAISHPSAGITEPTATAAPLAVAGPGSLAFELSDVEDAIRMPNVPDAAYISLGQREQKAYHLLEAHPDWIPPVMDAVPPSLHPTIQANLGAAQQIGTLNGVSASLPHWRIIAPAAPETLMA